MSRFKVGQKVVCINDKFHNTNGIHWACPKKGDVLTVLDIRGFFATPYLSFEELDRDSFFSIRFLRPHRRKQRKNKICGCVRNPAGKGRRSCCGEL